MDRFEEVTFRGRTRCRQSTTNIWQRTAAARREALGGFALCQPVCKGTLAVVVGWDGMESGWNAALPQDIKGTVAVR
jgi:hypothetical protein